MLNLKSERTGIRATVSSRLPSQLRDCTDLRQSHNCLDHSSPSSNYPVALKKCDLPSLHFSISFSTYPSRQDLFHSFTASHCIGGQPPPRQCYRHYPSPFFVFFCHYCRPNHRHHHQSHRHTFVRHHHCRSFLHLDHLDNHYRRQILYWSLHCHDLSYTCLTPHIAQSGPCHPDHRLGRSASRKRNSRM